MLSASLGLPFPRNVVPKIAPAVMHGHYLYGKGMHNVIVVWRDARDVLVSQYHHCYFENDLYNAALVRLMKKRFPFTNYDAVADNLPRFIETMMTRPLSPRFTWPQFVRKWWRRKVVHVFYEDLLNDAAGQVERVISEMGMPGIDRDKINEAVEEYSFRKAIERSPTSDPRRRFARKGVAGDWINYFNSESRAIFAHYGGDELIRLGYEKSYDWVKERNEPLAG
jgi:hypothetical protein